MALSLGRWRNGVDDDDNLSLSVLRLFRALLLLLVDDDGWWVCSTTGSSSSSSNSGWERSISLVVSSRDVDSNEEGSVVGSSTVLVGASSAPSVDPLSVSLVLTFVVILVCTRRGCVRSFVRAFGSTESVQCVRHSQTSYYTLLLLRIASSSREYPGRE